MESLELKSELKRNAFQLGWNWNWNAFQRLQTGIGIGMHSKLAWLELELESFHRKAGMYPRLIVFDHQIIREDPSNGSLQLQQQHLIASFIKKGTNPLLVDICHIATPLQNNISIVTKNHP